MSSTLNTDYVVIGAGAAGLAFTDTLLTESSCSVTVVDERERPGGHWCNSYDFVRLHQASAWYGVNSIPFEDDRVVVDGPDAGYHHMATGAEVRAYFERVLEDVLLPSGRVTYLPMTRYEGKGEVRSLVTGEVTAVRPARKLVDTTYVAGTTPARHTPAYSIGPGVRHVPVNALTALEGEGRPFIVLGGGKTGMDACLWLLSRGAEPGRLCWIVPQDPWMLDRAQYQPGSREFAAAMASQMEAAAEATSLEDLFARLEQKGLVLRLDARVTPTAYRCATVNRTELEQLRSIKNVVRLGRVEAIEVGRVEMQVGAIETDPEALHIDCTAKGIAPKPLRPIFEDGRITVQYVRACGQPSFSAAMIAAVETKYDDDDRKNALCRPVPGADRDVDWPAMTLASAANAMQWGNEPNLQHWLSRARLNIFRGTSDFREERDRLRVAFPGAVENLNRLCGLL